MTTMLLSALCLVLALVVNMDVKADDRLDVINRLARQLMLQQLAAEEKIRSDGDSGIKQIRSSIDGTRPYHRPSHTSNSACAMHDHANNIRTVGLGEFIGVLNGVEFRTRHNDYRLYMPSTTSTDYHAVEDIPFPDVPEEVIQHTEIKDQITEMKEWFRAFKEQNYTRRDYRKYFKPVLCYLEGAWTTSTDILEESFESDRHSLDADSWLDMQDKIRFTSYTGRKDNQENYAYLPTTIIDMKDGIPIMAQWNYRILCHPLKRDVPTNRLRIVDNLASRMADQRTYISQLNHRSTRFQVNPFDTEEWNDGKDKHGLLDELMEEIPGKDNYKAALTDDAYDLRAFELHRRENASKDMPLNSGYYNRWFKVSKKGAMGTQTRRRGYSDGNLFMAMTTQDKIAPMTSTTCKGRARKRVCTSQTQRWSYAIPLEIIYLTPLSTWNPYDIEYKGQSKDASAKAVTADGRNGGLTRDKAYNGTHSKAYYITPADFFSSVIGRDPADTAKGVVGVLDRQGEPRRLSASGQRIFQNIPDVGIVRTRYPIMPVHNEGSAIWKELDALKDMVMQSSKYMHLYQESLSGGPSSNGEGGVALTDVELRLVSGTSDHDHVVILSSEQVAQMMKNGDQKVSTVAEENEGHSHNVVISYTKNQRGVGKFLMESCDGKRRCEHPRVLEHATSP